MSPNTVVYAHAGLPIPLGRQGETNARRIVFDVSGWLREYGTGGTLLLLHKRPGDNAAYLVPFTQSESGDKIYWDVTDVDTDKETSASFGEAELRYSITTGNSDILAKSELFRTMVERSLGDYDPRYPAVPETESGGLIVRPVTVRPTIGDEGVVYLVPNPDSEDPTNTYVEWIYINDTWEEWGKYVADVDISGKADLSYVNAQLALKQDKIPETGAPTHPIYVSSNGMVSQTTYELRKSVPADAVFTDTTYSVATTSTDGLMSSIDKARLDGMADNATANTGTVTSVGTGAGLTGGPVTTGGTIKVDLRSETKLTNASAAVTETVGRVYPVALDKDGKLSVNVPWENTQAVTGVKGNVESTYRTGNINLTSTNIGAVPASSVGVAGGVAELDNAGKVPTSQLPSYVDDVLEYATVSDFPVTGESGKIYVATSTNLTYRWTGSGYTEISPSIALGETSSTAYRGDRGATAYSHSQTTGNPHGTGKSDVGLGNVTNYDQSKAIKSITRSGTTFTATALDGTTSTFDQQDTTYTPATSTPVMDGTAAVGASTEYARADHVHPTDTSRASTAVATQSANGLMSSEDKAKIDAVSLRDIAAAHLETYNGVNLATEFASEIAASPYNGDVWAWIKGRLTNQNLTGLHIKDWIQWTSTDNKVVVSQIAGINQYLNFGDTQISTYHIDFISNDLWAETHVWNKVLYNNGLEDRVNPYLCSDLKLWLNAEAGAVPNADTVNPATVNVDYTSTGVLARLPAALKNVIVEKQANLPKRYDANSLLNDDYMGGWVYASIGKLWVPSEMEVYGCNVFGTKANSQAEFTQYPIFRDSKMRVKGLGHNGSRTGWWTTTPLSGSTVDISTIYYNGLAAMYQTITTWVGAPVCFRIAG